MSSSVDNKIVKMQFDNAQFEAGVMKSMNTIDKLNEKLQFKEAAKGVSALQVAIAGIENVGDGVVANALKGVDKISEYTTTVIGKIKDKIKNEIAGAVTSAISTVTSIPAKALHQIESGGWSRANNLANAQFTVEGLGYDWDTMLKAINYGVLDTAYGLDSAAKAAASLAASGVGFEESIDGANDSLMHTSLRAISGVAAMTNSTYDEIAHIFTAVAGNGSLMGDHLMQLSTRGLNVAAVLAEQLGTTEAQIRDLAGKRAIDFETFASAMDSAFGDHAKEANKTFTGALSNMKAALSRIGAIFTQPVVDKTNTFFVALTKRIKEFQSALNDTKGYVLTEKGMEKLRKKANEIVKEYKGLSQTEALVSVERELEQLKNLAIKGELQDFLDPGEIEDYPIARFATHFAEMWQSGVNAASKIVEELDLSWFSSVADFLDNIAIRVKSFFDGIINYYEGVTSSIESVADKMHNTIGITLDDWNWINKVAIEGSYGYMQERWDKLDRDMNEVGGGKRIQGYVDQLAAVGYSYEALGWTEEEVRKAEENLTRSMSENIKELSDTELIYGNIAETFSHISYIGRVLIGDLTTIAGGFLNIGRAIGEISLSALNGFWRGLDFESLSILTHELWEAFKDLTSAFIPSITFLDKVGSAAEYAGSGLNKVLSVVISVATNILRMASSILHGKQSLEEFGSNETLSPIEKIAYHFVSTFSNIGTVAKNVFKSIKTILSSIRKAFNNVFKPSGVVRHVNNFTSYISELSSAFVLSEESTKKLQDGLESIFKVFKSLGTTVSGVFSKISTFFSKKTGLGAFGKTTKECADEITDLSKELVNVDADKAEGIFYRLKIIFSNIVETVKAAPGKIRAFIDELKKSESVEHLRQSFDRLKVTIKDTIDKILPPAQKALESFGAAPDEAGTEMGDKLLWVIEHLVDGVAWFVEKVTWFVGMIPEWKDNVTEFFTFVKASAEDFFGWFGGKLDTVAEKLGVGNLWEDLVGEWDSTAKDGESIISHVSTFASSMYESIVGVVNKVDWTKVGKVSLLTLTGMDLYKFFKVLDSTEGLIKGISAVPKTISEMFKSFNGLIGVASKGLGRLTNVYVFEGYVAGLIALIGAVLMLSEVPLDQMKTAIATMIILAGVMLALAAVVAQTNKGGKKTATAIQRSVNTFAQINVAIPALFGVASVIASLGLFLKLLADVVNDLAPLVIALSDEDWTKILVSLGMFALGLLAFIAIIGAIVALMQGLSVKDMDNGVAKKFFERNQVAETLAAMAAMIAAIAVAIYLISQAMINLSNDDVNAKGIWSVFGILVVVLAAAVGAIKFAQGVNHKALLSAAAMILLVGVSLYLIIGAIISMAASLRFAGITNSGEEMALAIGVIIGILALIGGSLILMMKTMQGLKPQVVEEIKWILLSCLAVIVSIGFMIKTVAGAFSENVGPKLTGVGVALASLALVAIILVKFIREIKASSISTKDLAITIGSLVGALLVVSLSIAIMAASFTDPVKTVLAIVGIGLTLLIMCKAMDSVAKTAKQLITTIKHMDFKKFITVFASLAGMMLVMALSTVLIAAAAKILDSCDPAAYAGAIGIAIGLFAVIALAVGLFAKFLKPESMQAATDAILMIGVTAVLISASVLLFATAVAALQDLDPKALSNTINVILVMLAIMALIFVVVSVIDSFTGGKGSQALTKVSDAMVAFGFSMLLVAASVFLVGLGFQAIGKGLLYLSDGIKVVAETFNEHKGATIIILLILAAITVVVIALASKLKALGNAAVSIGGTVVGGISGVVKKIGTLLKGGGEKLSKWWKKQSKSMKVAIGTGLITILGGIAAATPEALEQIGAMLFKVLDWLISILPRLVMWIVQFLVTLINSLADEIRNNSARIVQALFNLAEALMEVIIDVFGELIAMAFGAVPGIGEGLVKKVTEYAKGMKISLRSGLKGIDTYAKAMDELNASTKSLTDVSGAANKSMKALGKTSGGFMDEVTGFFKGGSDFDIMESLDFSKMTDMNMSGMSEIQKAGEKLGFDIPIGTDIDMSSFDITQASFGNMDAAGLDAFNNFSNLNDLEINAYDTGYNAGDMFDTGVSDFMDDEGYGNAENYAANYTNEYASEIVSPDAMYQVQNATQDLVDQSHNTMQSAENKAATEKAINEGIVGPANKALVDGASGVYQNAKTFGGAIQAGTLAGVNPNSVGDKDKRAADYIEEETDDFKEIFGDKSDELLSLVDTEGNDLSNSYKNYGDKTSKAATVAFDTSTTDTENAINDSSTRITKATTNWVNETNAALETAANNSKLIQRGEFASGMLKGEGLGRLLGLNWFYDDQWVDDMFAAPARDAAKQAAAGLEEGAGSQEAKQHTERAAKLLSGRLWESFNSKDGIDSHSPSKKFYQAGLFCVLGVRDAIAENTGLASAAMFNLSDQMINSFGDPLDYVSKMASGEIQYDPSIRPILDTSMLGTGVNAIDSMFANQNVSLSGMSGQIAYDMSTLNGSNAAVVAEIQALREDMDYMTEQMTNMQIVMDTGALVGATSGAMDKNLGIKRLYSERGDL